MTAPSIDEVKEKPAAGMKLKANPGMGKKRG
jgi:hypothetical protein